MTDKSREAFEAWAGIYYRHTDCYSKLDYEHGLAAWQAATDLSQPVQPAPLVPITDWDIDHILFSLPSDRISVKAHRDFARAIEAHHKIGVKHDKSGLPLAHA